MSPESIIQIIITVGLVIVTIIMVVINHRLTSNTEKFSHGNLIVNFQDKLSVALLLEQKVIEKYEEYTIQCDNGKKDALFHTPETYRLVESFTINYLNLVNSIAYLCTMKKSMLKEHKKYFEFYIAYGKKILDIRNVKYDNQSKYWEYIGKCVLEYDMKCDKSIPESISECYDPQKTKYA